MAFPEELSVAAVAEMPDDARFERRKSDLREASSLKLRAMRQIPKSCNITILGDMVFSVGMACATVTGELGHTLEQLSSKDRLFSSVNER